MITYFSWWYGLGLESFWQAIKVITKKIYNSFSIGTLLKTLFAPWKRDVVMVENASLDMRFRILIENLIAILVGFMVRFFTILVGLFLTGFSFLVMFFLLIVWVIMPFLVFLLIINGIRQIIYG